ncbi:MAG: hypothetical protein ACOCUL_01100, partial [Bacteroidota bacterium]
MKLVVILNEIYIVKMDNDKKNTGVLKTIIKILKWIIISIFSIILLVLILFQFGFVQEKVANIVLIEIKQQANTTIDLEKIRIGFFDDVVLKNLYVEDVNQDTLIFIGKLGVDINLFQLINKKIVIDQVNLEDTRGYVEKTLPDSSFNFSFILDSLSNGKEKKQNDNNQESPWEFSIDEVQLENVKLVYIDEAIKMKIAASLGNFFLEFDEFNLQEQEFIVQETYLKNSFLQYSSSGKPRENETGTDTPGNQQEPTQFGLKEDLLISNTTVEYNDQFSGQNASARIGELEIDPGKINLGEEEIAIEDILLAGSEIRYESEHITGNDNDTIKVKENGKDEAGLPGFPFRISVENITLKDNTIRYDVHNQGEKPRNKGINYDHLHLEKINGTFGNILLSDSLIKVKMKDFGFSESNSGFTVHELNTNAIIGKTKASANLFVSFNQSKLKNQFFLDYPDLKNITNQLDQIYLETEIKETSIQLQDLVYFYPAIAEDQDFFINRYKKINISTEITGYLDQLNIRDFYMKLGNSSLVNIKGTIKGLPSVNEARYDIKLNKIKTTRNDLAIFLPDTSLEKINLPNVVTLNGSFKGSVKDFYTKINLSSSQGNISAAISMEELEEYRNFKGKLNIDHYDVGKLISKPDTIGHLTLNGEIKGSLGPGNNISASLDIFVPEFTALNYTYNNINVDGIYKNKYFKGNASIDDDNLIFNFDGDVNLRDTLPVFHFTFNLIGADLQAMNLTKNDIRVKGDIVSDFSGGNIDDINGYLDIKDVSLIKDENKYDLSTFKLTAENTANKIVLDIKSDIVDAYYTGSVKFADFQDVITQYVSEFFDFGQEKIPGAVIPRKFQFEVWIKETDIITKVLVPGLESFEPAHLEGIFNNQENIFMLDALIPSVNYNGNELDTLAFHMETEQNNITYEAKVERLSSEPVAITNIELSGYVANDTIYNEL